MVTNSPERGRRRSTAAVEHSRPELVKRFSYMCIRSRKAVREAG